MNVIYIGFLYTENVMNKLLDLGSVIDYPGYNFQCALLKGLDMHYPNLKIVTTSYMSPYPNIKKIIFKQELFSHNGGDVKKDLFVGLVNLPIIKNISKFIRIRRGLIKSLESSNNTVILYELHTPFLLAVASLRNRIDHACVIVPDLPEYMSENRNPFYLLLKRIDLFIIHKVLKHFTSFVLFSEHMKEKLPIGNKKITVLEGIYLPTPISNEEKDKHKVVLYTGNLSKRSGIFNLLEAFNMIKNPDYQLWIRGGGTKEVIEGIEKYIAEDSRIKLFPSMSREELLTLQKKATILINPTLASSTYTRYFFPSKTMEYMASGTPTLMYKLDCLPKDYYPYLYLLEDESINTLSNTIISLCNKSVEELYEFGLKAATFISHNKTPQKQTMKIVKLLS